MKSLLKFITCGSVDDGKSTLIGHLLYDAKLLFADQKRALELETKIGDSKGQIDYSLLLDGLMAEREQGITIDVAYRYFATQIRSFIVADTPGHEQYTRNMAVGASFADLGIVLVDARKGILNQTKRHTRICQLMGINQIILAVNKMDLIEYDQAVFNTIEKEYQNFAQKLGFKSILAIPVSATKGDNITLISHNTPWYKGLSLLTILETIEIIKHNPDQGFSMPIQRVSRLSYHDRGFQGQIESGKITIGDEVEVFPSHEKARIKKLFITDQPVQEACSGQAVTLHLDKELDISRGCILGKSLNLEMTDIFLGTILWMDDQALIPGKNYLIKIGTKILPSTIMSIEGKLDHDTGDTIYSEALVKNEIGQCKIALAEKIAIKPFIENQGLGAFILLDRVSNMTAGCGIVNAALSNLTNVIWKDTVITKEYRAKQKAQQPLTIWFTGLSGSGKTTLANALEQGLVALGKHTMLLDGDNIRHGLSRNLGFGEMDRAENIRRIAEVAKLMNEAGLIVITAFISPYERDRKNAKKIIGENFIEIYVNTPLEECEKRDPKGLYQKVRNGDVPNFTGISSPYEPPQQPDMIVNTTNLSLNDATSLIMGKIMKYFN
jgi:bifunctional enzyme CysN/CysC